MVVMAAAVVATAGSARGEALEAPMLTLAQGPGRMTVALGISWLDDGLDLCDPGSPVFVADRLEPAPVIALPLPEAQRESVPDPAIPPAPDAQDVEVAAPVATKGAEDEADEDEDEDEVAAVELEAHPGLQRLLSATPEGEAGTRR